MRCPSLSREAERKGGQILCTVYREALYTSFTFCYIQVLSKLDDVPTHWGEQTTGSTDPHLKPSGNTLIHTPRNNIESGRPMVRQVDI